MKAKNISSLQVKCPHCGDTFSPEEAIEHTLRDQLEKEFENRLSGRLREVEEKEVGLQEKEKIIKDQQEHIELELRKRMLKKEEIIRADAEKRAEERVNLRLKEKERKLAEDREAMDRVVNTRIQDREEKVRNEERMNRAELEKKMTDQGKLIEEMNRKLRQGSMQSQGEVQEIAIEEYLESTFPQDEIGEIAKGKRGADCVHIVKDTYGNKCGSILYESKRTKHFGGDWISKLKEDMRLQQAEIGVIVTEAMPEGMTRFGEVDGVWICSFLEFKALAILFRKQLLRLGELAATQVNKGEKMNMVYEYVTGREFRQKMEAAFECYMEMQNDLTKEKALFAHQWAKREKSNLKSMENLVSLYGDVRGIAGGAVQEIKALEMPELDRLLSNA